MNDLLTAVQMYDFYLKELQLYLDTHPTCREALDLYRKYTALHKEACRMYSEKYGPLRPEEGTNEKCFDWVSGPWPWERSDD